MRIISRKKIESYNRYCFFSKIKFIEAPKSILLEVLKSQGKKFPIFCFFWFVFYACSFLNFKFGLFVFFKLQTNRFQKSQGTWKSFSKIIRKKEINF